VPGHTSTSRSSDHQNEGVDVRRARTEARQATRIPKRKRGRVQEDEEEERFYDAYTGLTDDADDYMTAVEEQPVV
jgi:hypothetical protein